MDFKKFKRSAARKKTKLKAFLTKLDKIVPHDMPKLVKDMNAQVWQEIDCTHCAGCCQHMTPTFRNADILRIAAHFEMTPQAFKDKWLYKEEEGDWVNKKQPCQFLKNNKCTIYEVRPKDCAEFPHHHKKPFDAYNDTFSNNLDKCPATFLLVDKLMKKVEADYVW